jgi:AbrB family looped-hinge helix DNA binding protein
MTEVIVKVMKKGIISIPAEFRKKLTIADGQHLLVTDDDHGNIILTPVESVESLRKDALTVGEFKKYLIQSRKEDLEREG